MDYVILIALWIGWCFLHSSMISLSVTKYFKDRLGKFFRFYRLFYNLVSLITFTLLYFYSGVREGSLFFRWEGGLVVFQLLLAMTGVFLFVAGGRNYDILHLFGLRQLTPGKTKNDLSENGEMDTSGIHGITRHPWYLGGIILLWTGIREIYVSTFIVNIILTIYLVIGTILEERKLVIEFGETYRNYQKKVSMLLPFKWVHSKCFN